MNNISEKIVFLDTTLRDGQQCPWAGIEKDDNYSEYIYLAKKSWFDIIEAWFPSASEMEYKRVNIASQICSEQWSPIIAWLCQLKQAQIEKTIEALSPWKNNQKSMLHTYFPVDPNLLKASVWDIDKLIVTKQVYDFVKLSVDAWMIVQFSPEWYSRVWDNFDFCTDLIISAVSWWAKYINCPDTIWWASRFQWENYFVQNMIKHKQIIDEMFPWNNVIWSLHNHNDFWLAVENSIDWVVNGIARKIEWTIWWVWERAWNADLLQIVMQMKHFLNDKFDVSHIDTTLFSDLWEHVSKHILKVQPHYPIIWKNATRHTSWWHTNAILKSPLVYQPYDPSEVGGEIELVFWPSSGWALAKSIIENAWYICEKNESAEIWQFIKNYWSKRYKWITDEELIEAYFAYRSPVNISGYDKTWDNITFYWSIFDKEDVLLTWWTIFQTLKNYIEVNNSKFKVLDFSANSDKTGEDSDSTSDVEIEVDWKVFSWTWNDNDIEMSSIKALINAYNKYYVEKHYKKNLT
jgi:2-isopropylmalate synthase